MLYRPPLVVNRRAIQLTQQPTPRMPTVMTGIANASAPSPRRWRSTCCAAELRGGRRRRAPVSRSESPESLQLRTISVRGGRKGDYFAERPGLLAAQGMVQEVLHEQPLVQGLEVVGEAVIQHPQVEIQVVNDAPAFGQRRFHRDPKSVL